MSNEPATDWRRHTCQWHANLFISVALYLCGGLMSLAAQPSSAELTTARAIRSLTVEQAEEGLPVRLRAVVTFFDEVVYGRFIQDDTAGIYLRESTNTPTLLPGQLVEVVGVTSPGEYAPIIEPEQVRILGEASLPEPKTTTFGKLASGGEDSQFVQISGVVRSVHYDDALEYYLIELATGGGRLVAYSRSLPAESNAELVDSTVRVRGVCATAFNRQRQLFSIRLMVPRSDDLMIEIPAPVAPVVGPARPIDSLFQFTPNASYGHRVKIAGTVTYFEPGKEIFLQDGTQGLMVHTRQRDPLQLGDRVEVLGFASHGQYTPVLQDATYRKTGTADVPVPRPVTHDAALKGTFDCLLVQLSAKVLDEARHGTDQYLILQAGGAIFEAHLSDSHGPQAFANLENGSRVSVTGVCQIVPGEWVAGEEWRAKAFRVLMRSPADLVVLEAPPWWTFAKVLGIAAVLAVVTVMSFGWVAVLRRQVAERTSELETQIQERQHVERQRLIEQERTRVAQDLHDELGATLTEVNMLSSLARTAALPLESKERYLEQMARVSRSLVATLDEVVWAVNPKYDSVDSLASYYSLFAQRFLKLSGISCRLQVAESFPDAPLDSRLRHEVFLAFKEALNNAVRHSGASEVQIEMSVVDRQLLIRVADNGEGFDSLAVLPGSDGLANMKQRIEKLGGRCEIDSKPGAGTAVQFLLPLGEDAV